MILAQDKEGILPVATEGVAYVTYQDMLLGALQVPLIALRHGTDVSAGACLVSGEPCYRQKTSMVIGGT